MMDTIKDYVSPKRLSVLSYVCVIIHFHCGVIFTAITTALRFSEMEKFSCAVDTNFATRKGYVEKTCFSIYEDAFNSPVKFSAFVLLSFGSVVVVSVVYSLAVGNRIDETERYSSGSDQPQTCAKKGNNEPVGNRNDETERYSSRSDEPQTGAKKGNNEPGGKTFYVFYVYLFHLVARSMLGILFTILQHTVLYPSGFDSQFSCVYPELRSADPNITAAKNASVTFSNVTCMNSTAQDKRFWATISSVCHVIFAIIALGEVIYLILKRFPRFNPLSDVAWSCDSEFIFVHFLCKQYVPEKIELTGVDNCTPNSCDIYKQKVLKVSLASDINYGPNTSLDDMFIDVVIVTGQAPHKFPKGMNRHEIYNVYMKIPEHSICLEEIKDLFYPNEDTKYNTPHTILALGRPGIGKTVLTRKIMCDWAKEGDEFYRGKIAFFFRLRWFNFDKLQSLTLKEFLRIGAAGLTEDEFESIFEEISRDPKKAIFVFDGLDELGCNVKKFEWYLDQSEISQNDPNISMPAMFLFVKIMHRYLLKEATILVTSRPTASDVYSRLSFDRTVEIIGFTSDKIEKFVQQFCVKNNKTELTDDDLKAKILSHINSSSELKNLCYIPVNCFIVCGALSNCFNDNEALPATLTELYEAALVYFHKYHDRNKDNECYEKLIEELQKLAFYGMEKDKLIFYGKLLNEKMKESGLLHYLPIPVYQMQTQTQFCFVHLTVQEFLAARYIVETKEPEDIKEFISSHVEYGRWHLVLQFLAGLLGEKMKMSDQYRSCVLTFTKYLSCEIKGEHIVCVLYPRQILVMKCLRETEDEDICNTSALKDVTRISGFDEGLLSPSDLAAMVFLCKHLHFLTDLNFSGLSSLDCSLEVMKLLQERCIKTLYLPNSNLGDLGLERCVLMKSECHMNHEHSKLTELHLPGNNITDAGVLHLNEFLKNSHGACLKELNLGYNKITSRGILKLCEVLGNKVCSQLTELHLGSNAIGDEGVHILSTALRKNQLKLTELVLQSCALTSESISWLVEFLSDKHCQIAYLSLAYNEIGDESVGMLCEVFKQEQCKLAWLDLGECSLTEKCMSALCEVLGEEHCGLTNLNLGWNNIGDEGLRRFCSVPMKGQCKLTWLCLSRCSLTDECLPSLCKLLEDERFRLTTLDLSANAFTDKHLSLLSDTLKLEHCCLQHLEIPLNAITEEGKRLLKKTMESEHCKARYMYIYLGD